MPITPKTGSLFHADSQVWPHPAQQRQAWSSFANTRRTPNPAFGDWDRSARQGPSRRRRGSRRCGTQRASAHRRCNPAHRDERKLRLSAAGAPARHRGSAPSADGPSASYRASRPLRCRGTEHAAGHRPPGLTAAVRAATADAALGRIAKSNWRSRPIPMLPSRSPVPAHCRTNRSRTETSGTRSAASSTPLASNDACGAPTGRARLNC
jgi:hypothetical protein